MKFHLSPNEAFSKNFQNFHVIHMNDFHLINDIFVSGLFPASSNEFIHKRLFQKNNFETLPILQTYFWSILKQI